MAKTFYSVEYSGLFCGTSKMWFDNYSEAKTFSLNHPADRPVKHSYKDPEKIERAEYHIWEQKEADKILKEMYN